MQRAIPTGNAVASDSDATGDNGMGSGGRGVDGRRSPATRLMVCDIGALACARTLSRAHRARVPSIARRGARA